jgi:hypothetical protein
VVVRRLARKNLVDTPIAMLYDIPDRAADGQGLVGPFSERIEAKTSVAAATLFLVGHVQNSRERMLPGRTQLQQLR